ncbi:hypothetical protein Bca4012_029354 [Brassica carinata]
MGGAPTSGVLSDLGVRGRGMPPRLALVGRRLAVEGSMVGFEHAGQSELLVTSGFSIPIVFVGVGALCSLHLLTLALVLFS